MTVNSSHSQPFKEIFIETAAVESIAELVKIQLHISSFNTALFRHNAFTSVSVFWYVYYSTFQIICSNYFGTAEFI